MMGDLRIGDHVFDERGEACRVTGVTEIMYGRPCYEMEFSDGERVVGDAEHEWLTVARIDKPGGGPRGGYKHGRTVHERVRTTREIAETQTAGGRGDRNHSIRLAGPLRTNDAILPVDPYVLGAWLGDGETAAARLTCSYEDGQILTEIEASGVVVQEGTSSNSGSGLYHLGSPAGRAHSLQATLRHLGVLGQKHIPPAYLRASVQQRLALLQGLMDTDGYVSRAGECEFTTRRQALSEGVRELVVSLGFKPTMKVGRALLYGKDCGPKYRIAFFASSDVPVFRLDRKSERQRQIGPTARSRTRQIVIVRPVASVPVRCIQVDSPSQLYLAGRSMVPTHNSTLAAGFGLLLAFYDDEPGAEVYCSATKRDQAKLIWSEAQRMVRSSPELRGDIKVLVGNLHAGNSKFMPLGADEDSTDGLNIHGNLVDELHAHKTRSMWDVLITAMGSRRQPLTFVVTTAGSDRNSICWEQHEYGEQVLAGVIDDDSYFAYIAAIDEEDSWRDPACWPKANPNLGVSVKLEYLLIQCHQAEHSPAKQNTFQRLHCNRWTQQHDRWIDLDLWDANAGAIDEEKLRGRECYGMLDLATVSDMTAWVLGFPSEVGRKFGSHVCDEDCIDIIARFWCPEAKVDDPGNRYADQYRVWRDQRFLTVTRGNATDFEFVQAQVLKDAETFQLVDMNVDRLFQAHQIGARLADEGIKIFGLGMGHLGMAAPMAEFHRRLLGGQIHHGGNPVLRWMADNVSVKQDASGNLKPDKSTSQGKIDGIIGIVGVIDRIMRHEEAPRSRYEDEGAGIVAV